MQFESFILPDKAPIMLSLQPSQDTIMFRKYDKINKQAKRKDP